MSTSNSPLEEFIATQGLDLPGLTGCLQMSKEQRYKLENLFETPPISPDTDLVVFGSLARNECTSGSDVDWTLLIDGQANADHLRTANQIPKQIKEKGMKDPGRSGIFGNTTISHDLIHYIGGDKDSNHNLTRRILLLLESERINLTFTRDTGGTAYERVVTGVISQYVNNDSGLKSPRLAIPRFLLNDIVRFWRTMCVDFAYKQKEQEGQKWALRNLKLRMSRKLLFVKGLLMCFANSGTTPNESEIAFSLREMVKLRPMDLMISLRDQFKIPSPAIITLLVAYDKFLLALHDEKLRHKFEEMPMEAVYHDGDFLRMREICDDFQDGLNEIFLVQDGLLCTFTLQYGIF